MKSMLEADGRLVHFMFFADHYQPSPHHHICHHSLFVITIIIVNTRLSHSIIFADQLKAKNQGDKVRGGFKFAWILDPFLSPPLSPPSLSSSSWSGLLLATDRPRRNSPLAHSLSLPLLHKARQSVLPGNLVLDLYEKHFLSLYSWVGPTSYNSYIQK